FARYWRRSLAQCSAIGGKAMSGLRRRWQVRLAIAATGILATGTAVAASGASGAIASTGSGTTREISSSGTASVIPGSPGQPGGIDNFEIAGVGGDDALAPDRSHSSGVAPVGSIAQPKMVTTSTPNLVTSFNGLDHFDQRFGTGPNQFSLEPPDQGLCVGSDGNSNTRVLEVLNDVLRVYTTSGTPVTSPTALNRFLVYARAVIRTTSRATFGPFVTDPSCLYDAQTGHWFLDALTLDTFPHPGTDGLQHFTGTNHLDLAVSNTSDPAG